MIGDRQPVPLRRLEQVLAGHAEIVELQPVIVQVPQGQQAILDDLEVLVLVIGQVDDEDRRPILDQADQSDRTTGHGVGDEQLLAVDHVVVAVEHGSRLEGGQVGAGAGLGEREGRQLPAAGQQREIAFLLLGRAEAPQGIHRADAAVDRRQTGQVRLDRGHLGQEARERRERRAFPAILRVDEQPPVSDGAQVVEHRLGHLPVRAEERSGLAMTACDVERVAHRPLRGRRWLGRLGREQVDRDLVFPDRLMDRAVDRLVARGEQGFHLIIGPVDRAGLPRLLLALPAQLQCGLDERLGLGLPQLGIHELRSSVRCSVFGQPIAYTLDTEREH